MSKVFRAAITFISVVAMCVISLFAGGAHWGSQETGFATMAMFVVASWLSIIVYDESKP